MGDLDLFDFELSESELRKISAQEHCRAGNQVPPYCHVPYFRGENHRICNIDGRGGQASNWECDDDLALTRAALEAGLVQDAVVVTHSCAEAKDYCDDVEVGAIAREHCKASCQQPCQDTVILPSHSLV